MRINHEAPETRLGEVGTIWTPETRTETSRIILILLCIYNCDFRYNYQYLKLADQ